MAVTQASLLKALGEMEAIAKGDSSGGNKTPKTTHEANGGLSDEGDEDELNTDGDLNGTPAAGVSKSAKKKGGKSFKQWAKEEEEESAHKAVNDDESESDSDESESDDSESISKAMDDESESESESEPPMKKHKKKAHKSAELGDLIKSDSAAGPVVDVSPFIESLVDQVSEADKRMHKSHREMHREMRAHNAAQGKVIGLLVKSLIEMRKEISELGNAPVGDGMRKSVVRKSEVQERFDGGEDGFEFSKSDVLNAMVDMVSKGEIPSLAVSQFEMTESMEPEIQAKVEKFLKKSA